MIVFILTAIWCKFVDMKNKEIPNWVAYFSVLEIGIEIFTVLVYWGAKVVAMAFKL